MITFQNDEAFEGLLVAYATSFGASRGDINPDALIDYIESKCNSAMRPAAAPVPASEAAKQTLPHANVMPPFAAPASQHDANDSATDALYLDIMNIPCDEAKANEEYSDRRLAYKHGHRDARHAAADLVSEFASGFREGRNASDGFANLAAPAAPTDAKPNWWGSLAQVIMDIPLPERNDKYQSGFVDAKQAILQALRGAGFDRQPAAQSVRDAAQPTEACKTPLSAARHAVHNLKEFRAGRTTFPGEALGILESYLEGAVTALPTIEPKQEGASE